MSDDNPPRLFPIRSVLSEEYMMISSRDEVWKCWDLKPLKSQKRTIILHYSSVLFRYYSVISMETMGCIELTRITTELWTTECVFISHVHTKSRIHDNNRMPNTIIYIGALDNECSCKLSLRGTLRIRSVRVTHSDVQSLSVYQISRGKHQSSSCSIKLLSNSSKPFIL